MDAVSTAIADLSDSGIDGGGNADGSVGVVAADIGNETEDTQNPRASATLADQVTLAVVIANPFYHP